MEPKLKQLDETSTMKKEAMEELNVQKSEKAEHCKNEEEVVNALKTEVDSLKSNSDRELMEVKEKLEGISNNLNYEDIKNIFQFGEKTIF